MRWQQPQARSSIEAMSRLRKNLTVGWRSAIGASLLRPPQDGFWAPTPPGHAQVHSANGRRAGHGRLSCSDISAVRSTSM